MASNLRKERQNTQAAINQLGGGRPKPIKAPSSGMGTGKGLGGALMSLPKLAKQTYSNYQAGRTKKKLTSYAKSKGLRLK